PRDVGFDAVQVPDAYRERFPDADAWTVLMRHLTDARFRLPALALAAAKTGAPAYVFEFAWETAVLGDSLSAGHRVDLSCPFDTPDVHPATESNTAARRLAPVVSDAWLALARNGDPNHAELPAWPPYADGRAVITIADECQVSTGCTTDALSARA